MVTFELSRNLKIWTRHVIFTSITEFYPHPSILKFWQEYQSPRKRRLLNGLKSSKYGFDMSIFPKKTLAETLVTVTLAIFESSRNLKI